jgi:hypothetical protein
VIEFEGGEFLEEEGVLMGELTDDVGDGGGAGVLMTERKVKMPLNILRKSKSLTLLNTSFRAPRYFLMGSSYLPRRTLTPPKAQPRSRSSRYYSLEKNNNF